MALVATITTVDKIQHYFIVAGTIAASGSYALHGDTLDLTPATAVWPIGWSGVPASGPPVRVKIWSNQPASASATTTLFEYRYNPGTTQANGTVQVFTGAAAQAGLTELTAGAYGAGVTGDAIKFEAWIASI